MGLEAVVVGVASDQFVQTTLKYPKQMRNMRNTTTNWAWSKKAKGKISGLHCEEIFLIAFVSRVQEGTYSSA